MSAHDDEQLRRLRSWPATLDAALRTIFASGTAMIPPGLAYENSSLSSVRIAGRSLEQLCSELNDAYEDPND